ncbi:unnamed protein product [Effrenium voratum]|uniref:Glycosyl hydrolase family 32 C-terminal domain-containing protein n=1 Tax=Effrenium voratum TaxID=2562239 RepID=A0AA36JM03_9DINO|nr:unnamed protein product [Effrenium voratum]
MATPCRLANATANGDRLRLLRGERSLEIRIFADATFLEVFFQQGRLAMTVDAAPLQAADLVVKSTAEAGLPARVLGPGSGQGQ